MDVHRSGDYRCYDFVETPFGRVTAISGEIGLNQISLPQSIPDHHQLLRDTGIVETERCPLLFSGLWEMMEGYFQGVPIDFRAIELDFTNVSRFMRLTWTACREIPVGETRSYSWLAGQIGKPTATRAVGQSMARNRFPFVVPCHRVISSDGGLGGFGSDRKLKGMKRSLLELEGVNVSDWTI